MPSELPFTAESLLADAALRVWPMPEDPFETALWAQSLEEAASGLSVYANRLFHERVQVICEEGLTSPVYRVVFPVTAVRTVDAARLKAERPALYGELAYVSGADAVRILGKARLTACCFAADEDRTRSLLRVNLGDVARVLRPEELTGYVLIHERPERPVVVRVDGGAVC